MKLAELCIRRPVFATMLVMLFVVLGWMSYRTLGVDLFPNVDFPITSVTSTLKGASVEEVETRVTKPIEEAVNQIEGIDELSSVTKEGTSRVLVQFMLERHNAEAAQDVRDKVATTLAKLPPAMDPPVVVKFDLDASPVMRIAVSGDRDPREITEIARKKIKEDIETISGVGSVTIIGGQERAVQIYVDTDKLDAYNLSIAQVRRALQSQNVELPGGRIDQGSRELVLRTMGRMPRVEDFNDLVIGRLGDRALMLRDIATVVNGTVEPRSFSSLDGRDAVTLEVRKQSGSNTVEVVEKVKRRLDQLREIVPPDIRFEVVKDQSRFIKESIHEAQFHLILGAILVAFSTMLFMGDIRSTLIAAIAIPTSIISTFTAIRLLGFTINNLTILALILSVGIVIDDAVVVLENIFRRMEEKGEPPFEAALNGTREIGLAVMATTFSLVVIFVPIAFMSGRVGRFFNEFGITTAVAILFSMLISFTLTPMLCSRFLKVNTAPGHKSAKDRAFYRAIDRSYGWLLEWSLRHRWVIVVAAIATVYSTVPIFKMVGKDFIPQDDQSEFEVILQTPEGYTLERSSATFEEVARRLRDLRGVKHTLVTIGDTSGFVAAGEGDVTTGGIYVKLVDLHERQFTQKDVMKDARALLAEYPDLRASVQGVNMFAGGGNRMTDFEFDLVGPELDQLQRLGEKITAQMAKIPGFVDIDTTLALRKPEIRVNIDRKKAADLGIRVEDIAGALRTLVGGEPVSKYKEADEQYDVWLRASLPNRSDPHSIYNLAIERPNGELVRLSNLVTLEEEKGPAQIDRFSRQRKLTVVANLDNLPLSDAIAHVNRIVAGIDMPQQYAIRYANRAKGLDETGKNFAIAFGLSFVFMYMILAAQFESFLHPITIMLSLPLSIPFALLSLLLLHETLNVYSVLGLFMLFGIVKKNGILQVDYTNTLRAEGMPRDEAIITANHVRLRPILMTTVMLVAGMIPIALGRGPGAASRASLANVIVGGQTLCLVLTLLVTPVAYSLFDDLGTRLSTVRAWRALRDRIADLRASIAGAIASQGNGRHRS
ncbi:MAG TPA: efflux RND transporter permease subunit [Candidatus Binatia bacterium]|nr:efflux RND transporter permease subunit [Candidatus Binatia bacterium]